MTLASHYSTLAYISQTPNSVKSAFLRVHFELRFEHEAEDKGTQYLKLEVR